MIVYKITNLINNKPYIGYDGSEDNPNNDNRWRAHCKHYKNTKSKQGKKLLYKAMRKYGIKNFSYEIIEFCKSINELKQKERYYIKKFNSLAVGGWEYNCTPGGDGTSYNFWSEESKKSRRKIVSKQTTERNNKRWADPKNRKKQSIAVSKGITKKERKNRKLRMIKLWADSSLREQRVKSIRKNCNTKKHAAAARKNLDIINKNKLNNKIYKIVNPNGKIYIVKDVPKFCKRHFQNPISAMVCLRQLARNKYPKNNYKNWKCWWLG